MASLRSILRKVRSTPAPTQEADPATDPGTAAVTSTLAGLTAQRRHDDAVALATDSLAAHANDKEFLRQVRTSAAKAGAISLQRQATARQLEAFPDEKLTVLARRQEGRWNETEPGWSPTITPAVAPLEDSVAGRVLHVLKASMPHRQSGYTMRSMYTLTSQRAVGLDVVATTSLDFPGTTADVTGTVETVAEVPHVRLTRDAVPAGQPPDAYLDDWASALAPVVAEQRPEILHVHSGQRGYDSALVGLTVGAALGVPVVYEVRGFFESLWTSDVEWAERSEIFRRRYETDARCMRAADAVVTLSQSMRDEIVSRGVDPARVHIVPNGVDTESFAPRPRSAELTERLGLAGRFVFGYVSNLDHHREGHELLIEAAAALKARGVPATALIVGDGSRRAALEKLTAELGAHDVVLFTGKVPHAEVLDYYAQYDVFVVPRVDERAARLVTPLKPFEAMATGIPVVVSDLPALREIIGDGERGRTFRIGDAGSLVDTLLELQGDDALRQRLATAGRDWTVAERQWAANGERYRSIYAEVLGRA